MPAVATTAARRLRAVEDGDANTRHLRLEEAAGRTVEREKRHRPLSAGPHHTNDVCTSSGNAVEPPPQLAGETFNRSLGLIHRGVKSWLLPAAFLHCH